MVSCSIAWTINRYFSKHFRSGIALGILGNCFYNILQLFVFQAVMSLIVNLIKPFFIMNKTSRQTFQYRENEKSFYGEIKSIFHHFSRAFSYQKCLRSDITQLSQHMTQMTVTTGSFITTDPTPITVFINNFFTYF